jgi:hypothetical protein
MARRPDQREAEMLSEENLRELRHNLAHLSLPAVRDFYEQAYRDCRLIYNQLPTPKQIQNTDLMDSTSSGVVVPYHCAARFCE